ncbi:MAG: porin family protein [Spirochaetaceae bacterium]|nr:porin family protein [Spirochaetaceae bacterium]
MAKKMVLGLVLVMMTTAGAFAQQKWYNTYSPCIQGSKALVNVGIGYGSVTWGSMGIPPITASIDFKLKNNPITIGAFGAFSTFGGGIFANYTNIGFGGRAAYHFNFAKKLDTYVGLSLGYVLQSTDVEWAEGVSFFLWGFNLGARYFFTKRLGAYLELGYSGLQVASVGLTFKI